MEDIHTEHCCIVHGCKYGDDDCVVTTGKKRQSYPCECCDDDKRHYRDEAMICPHHGCEVTGDGCPECTAVVDKLAAKHKRSESAPIVGLYTRGYNAAVDDVMIMLDEHRRWWVEAREQSKADGD